VCDVKVDADAIHLHTVFYPSVSCTQGGARLYYHALISSQPATILLWGTQLDFLIHIDFVLI